MCKDMLSGLWGRCCQGVGGVGVRVWIVAVSLVSVEEIFPRGVTVVSVDITV